MVLILLMPSIGYEYRHALTCQQLKKARNRAKKLNNYAQALLDEVRRGHHKNSHNNDGLLLI